MTAQEFGIKMYEAIQEKKRRKAFKNKLESRYTNHKLDSFMRDKQRRYYSSMKSN